MDWIILFQNQYNRIVFVSSQNPDERDSMSYEKFLSFINNEFVIKNFIEFCDKVDRFKVIYLTKDGTWEIMEEDFTEASFQDLYHINGNKEEDEEKSITESKVDKSKDLLNKIFDFRKKETKHGIKLTNS
jgi:hypothetical protein